MPAGFLFFCRNQQPGSQGLLKFRGLGIEKKNQRYEVGGFKLLQDLL